MFGSDVKYNKFILGACFVGAVASAAYYMLMPQNATAQPAATDDVDEDGEGEEKKEFQDNYEADSEDDDIVVVPPEDEDRQEIEPQPVEEGEADSGNFVVVPRVVANAADTQENGPTRDENGTSVVVLADNGGESEVFVSGHTA